VWVHFRQSNDTNPASVAPRSAGLALGAWRLVFPYHCVVNTGNEAVRHVSKRFVAGTSPDDHYLFQADFRSGFLRLDGRMEGEAHVSDSAVPARRRSYQFRALSRRAATHHRRHWKLDICCLGLCPGYKRRFNVTNDEDFRDHCRSPWHYRSTFRQCNPIKPNIPCARSQ